MAQAGELAVGANRRFELSVERRRTKNTNKLPADLIRLMYRRRYSSCQIRLMRVIQWVKGIQVGEEPVLDLVICWMLLVSIVAIENIRNGLLEVCILLHCTEILFRFGI